MNPTFGLSFSTGLLFGLLSSVDTFFFFAFFFLVSGILGLSLFLTFRPFVWALDLLDLLIGLYFTFFFGSFGGFFFFRNYFLGLMPCCRFVLYISINQH